MKSNQCHLFRPLPHQKQPIYLGARSLKHIPWLSTLTLKDQTNFILFLCLYFLVSPVKRNPRVIQGFEACFCRKLHNVYGDLGQAVSSCLLFYSIYLISPCSSQAILLQYFSFVHWIWGNFDVLMQNHGSQPQQLVLADSLSFFCSSFQDRN